MLVRPIENSEIEKWEQYVEDKPTIAWQSYYWSEVVKSHYKAEFFPLAAFDDGRIVGILPLYKVRTLRGKPQLISVPYAVAGGIVADDFAVEKALIDAAINLYKEHQANRIVFKQYKYKLSGPLRTDDNFYNRELDLTRGIDHIFANINAANKANIEKSDGLDLKLNHPSNDIDQFYRLMLLHHKNNGVPCVSLNWIRDLIDFNMYSIALLRHNGKTVAGTLVKAHKQTVSFPFTSLPDDSDRSNMFAYNLYWRLIRKFTREGKAIFHSGRIPKNNETNCYRLGWGGVKNMYYYQYYPDGGGASEFSTKRGRKRQLISAIWRRLPLSLTGLLGSKIVKYFP